MNPIALLKLELFMCYVKNILANNIRVLHTFIKNITHICLKLIYIKGNIIWHKLSLLSLGGIMHEPPWVHDQVAGIHPHSGFNNKIKTEIISIKCYISLIYQASQWKSGHLLRSLRLHYCREVVKHYNMPALTHAEHMADS